MRDKESKRFRDLEKRRVIARKREVYGVKEKEKEMDRDEEKLRE